MRPWGWPVACVHGDGPLSPSEAVGLRPAYTPANPGSGRSGRSFATLGYPDGLSGLRAVKALRRSSGRPSVESEPGAVAPVQGQDGVSGARRGMPLRRGVDGAGLPPWPQPGATWRHLPGGLGSGETGRAGARRGWRVRRSACRRSRGLLLAWGALSACGSYSPAAVPAPHRPTVVFGRAAGEHCVPAGGGTRAGQSERRAGALTVSFSVTVPPRPGRRLLLDDGGQAGQPPGTGFVTPVVTTRPFEPVTLAAGTQSVSVAAFHTTNAVCSHRQRPAGQSHRRASTSRSRTTASFGAPAFFGKKFPVTFVLHCR